MIMENIIITKRDFIGSNLNQSVSQKIYFKNCEQPLVSIIITAFNNYKYTKSCLYYIHKHTNNINYEVILADDNSTDETKKISREFDNVNIIRNSERLGFLQNVNNAVKSAKGKYICILHNDTIPKQNWLEPLIDVMESNQNVGIVGPKILSKDGLMSEEKYFIDEMGYYKNSGDILNDKSDVDFCPDCAVLIRKSAWESIGGFDNIFSPVYYEDVDLALSFKNKLGLAIKYQPKSEVVHFNIHAYNDTKLKNYNRINFYLKWKTAIQQKFRPGLKGANINVCFCLTDNYSQHTGTAIASILLNSNLKDKYCFYLLSDYISQENQEYFKLLKSIRDFEIFFLQVDNKEFEDVKILNHLGYPTLYRFKMFDSINVDKILYLDSDLVVGKDLHELYETDISNYYAAAVEDAFSNPSKDRCELKESATYVNAGVILFNLKKCKKDNLSKKLFELSKNPPNLDIIYADQDMLNIVMQTKIKLLSDKWNCLYLLVDEYKYEKELNMKRAKDSVIIHFSAYKKPWIREFNSCLKEEYFQYLRFTPWYDEFMEYYNE